MKTNANVKKVTVNLNSAKNGLEVRFGFALTKLQKAYVEKTLGMHWFHKKQYYWVGITAENYELLATYIEALQARGYKVTIKETNGSLRAPRKATK